MDKLKFSVSMCVYSGDRPDWLNEALESVYNQTIKPDEVVLLVDGPISNELNNIVIKFETNNDLKVYRLERNYGHGIARNECLNHCSYDYVAIADADDINERTRFEKQIKCFEKDKTLSAVSSWCSHFTDSIDKVINLEKTPETDEEIKLFMKKRCPMCQPSVMFKKSVVKNAGGYQDWFLAEDYYLWIRLALNNAKFYNIQESLLYLRTNEKQSIRRGGFKYFKSMRKLFIYMRKNKLISFATYFYNVVSRFIIQVLMPSKIRSIIRKKFL